MGDTAKEYAWPVHVEPTVVAQQPFGAKQARVAAIVERSPAGSSVDRFVALVAVH